MDSGFVAVADANKEFFKIFEFELFGDVSSSGELRYSRALR